MKYFRFDLLEDETQWEQNDTEYSKVFESLKPLLSKDFLEVYLAEHGFHDKTINKIIVSDNASLTVELIKRDGNFIRITYKGVEGFKFLNIDKVCKERQISNLLEWGYDEFSENGEKLTHSVLSSCGFEFELSFQSISAVYTNEELKAEGSILYI